MRIGVERPTAFAASPARLLGNGLRRALYSQSTGLVAALLLIGVIATFGSPYFLQTSNLLDIADASAIVAVLAVMQTIVVISGGLDLSVGSVAGLTGVVAAILMQRGVSAPAAIAAALATGAAAGLINGIVITVGRVNAIIATLAGLSAYLGLALIVANGATIGVTNQAFSQLGSRVLGVPMS